MNNGVFESKITKLSASKNRAYPSIRLPKSYADIIGNKAQIYPTSYDGKQAFLVVVDNESLNSEFENPLENRIKNLESQIEELRNLVSKKESNKTNNSEINGPAAIRTQDPRHVKAMS